MERVTINSGLLVHKKKIKVLVYSKPWGAPQQRKQCSFSLTSGARAFSELVASRRGCILTFKDHGNDEDNVAVANWVALAVSANEDITGLRFHFRTGDLHDPDAFFEAMAMNPRLKRFEFRQPIMSDGVVDRIVSLLALSRNLKRLTLHSDFQQRGIPWTITTALRNHVLLTHLTLIPDTLFTRYNNIIDIFQPDGRIALTYFDISACYVNEKDLIDLLYYFEEDWTLKVLKFSFSDSCFNLFIALEEFITYNGSVKELVARQHKGYMHCRLFGLDEIGRAVAENTALRHVELWNSTMKFSVFEKILAANRIKTFVGRVHERKESDDAPLPFNSTLCKGKIMAGLTGVPHDVLALVARNAHNYYTRKQSITAFFPRD